MYDSSTYKILYLEKLKNARLNFCFTKEAIFRPDAALYCIMLQFDLVCDRAIYPTIGLVALNAGGPIGVYLFGTLNDR